MLCGIKEDLKNLHKELTVGGTSLSLRKYVETLQEKYESKVVQDSRCDLKHLTQMTKDDVGSALIPREELEGEMEALKASGDGNCLFNSASILIEGGESANHVLRLLTAAELFMNPQYYAHHY